MSVPILLSIACLGSAHTAQTTKPKHYSHLLYSAEMMNYDVDQLVLLNCFVNKLKGHDGYNFTRNSCKFILQT